MPKHKIVCMYVCVNYWLRSLMGGVVLRVYMFMCMCVFVHVHTVSVYDYLSKRYTHS